MNALASAAEIAAAAAAANDFIPLAIIEVRAPSERNTCLADTVIVVRIDLPIFNRLPQLVNKYFVASRVSYGAVVAAPKHARSFLAHDPNRMRPIGNRARARIPTGDRWYNVPRTGSIQHRVT